MKKLFPLIALISFCLASFAQDKPAIEWVSISAGTFIMGSKETEAYRNNCEEQHKVIIILIILNPRLKIHRELHQIPR
jgi:hypothetical protein